MLPNTQVFLKNNPWRDRLPDGVVMQFLTTASVQGARQIQQWMQDGGQFRIGSLLPALGMVILDPTRPDGQSTIQQRIMAAVLFGDGTRAEGFLPYAAAGADAHYRHGRSIAELVATQSYVLGDGDFAGENSVRYGRAIAAGYGLSQVQNRFLTSIVLTSFMDAIHGASTRWLAERNRGDHEHVWYDWENEPDPRYRIDLSDNTWRSPSPGS